MDEALPGGLAVYGARFGRYPLDPTVVFVRKRASRRVARRRVSPVLILASALLARARRPAEARIAIDAAQVEGRIDARLYGQFLEFMYEGIKGGRPPSCCVTAASKRRPTPSASPAIGSATPTIATTTTG